MKAALTPRPALADGAAPTSSVHGSCVGAAPHPWELTAQPSASRCKEPSRQQPNTSQGSPSEQARGPPFPLPMHAPPCPPQHGPPPQLLGGCLGRLCLGRGSATPPRGPPCQDQRLSGCPTGPEQPRLSPSPWGSLGTTGVFGAHLTSPSPGDRLTRRTGTEPCAQESMAQGSGSSSSCQVPSPSGSVSPSSRARKRHWTICRRASRAWPTVKATVCRQRQG